MKEGVIELRDGRRLGYGEWGPPDAPVVFYCHGFPGSHDELDLAVPVAERSNLAVRVIALDRPGYGASTYAPGRTFLDWPQDVVEVADRLRVGDFAVLGASGGSPFALACGYLLGDRVKRIGIVVGSAPIEAPGMSETPIVSGSSRFRLMRRLQYGLSALAIRKGREDRFIDQAIAMMSPVDRLAMDDPGTREWFLKVTREAFRQGGRAAASESGLYRLPWGFDLAAVTQETWLWYGGVDQWSPAASGKWMADRLPNSHYLLWPQHGHFTWIASYEIAEVLIHTAGLG